MLAVDGKAPPPLQLKMMWRCDRFNVRPDQSESVLDWPVRLLNEMETLEYYYNAVTRYRKYSGGKSIHQLSHSDRVALRWLMDAGIWNG